MLKPKYEITESQADKLLEYINETAINGQDNNFTNFRTSMLGGNSAILFPSEISDWPIATISYEGNDIYQLNIYFLKFRKKRFSHYHSELDTFLTRARIE